MSKEPGLIERLERFAGDTCISTALEREAAAALRAAEERIAALEGALEGVIRIADRDCPEFRIARAALADQEGK